MVNASRLTYPHCRSTGCTAGTSVPRPAMPMLSRHCPHPIHVITVDIHEFQAQVVHLVTGPPTGNDHAWYKTGQLEVIVWTTHRPSQIPHGNRRPHVPRSCGSQPFM